MPKAPPVNLSSRIAGMNKKPAAKKAPAKDVAMRAMYAKGKPGMTSKKATAKQRPGKAY